MNLKPCSFLLWAVFWIVLWGRGQESRAFELWQAPELQASAMRVNPGSWGTDAGGTLGFQILENHSFFVGPRVSLFWASPPSGQRLEFNGGAQAQLWFVNAMSPGVALDWVAPSHTRYESFFTVRVLHFREVGAWEPRVGLLYDSRFQFAVRMGLALQLSGTSPSLSPGD